MSPRFPSLESPSASLPPLLTLHDYTAIEISHALQNIRDLYFSPLHASPQDKIALPMHRHGAADTSQVPDSGYASEEEEGNNGDKGYERSVIVDALRTDPFERAFVIRWLTGFLSRGHVWASTNSGDRDDMQSNSMLEIIDDVSSLLSLFSGISEQGPAAITRKFQFSLGQGGRSISVELNDESLPTEDHTSVGLQSWASSVILAERLCTSPATFGLTGRPLRILELGAGTGLLSIVTSKILSSSTPTIVASDFHLDVLANCTTNLKINACESSILVRHLDWEKPTYDGVLEETFDVVLASDVIYHVDHARWIKGVVERVLAKPSCHHEGYFWLLIPMRTTGRHENIDQTVDTVFGKHPTGLVIIEQVEIARKKTIGRADESGYKLFKIGWVF